MSDQAISCDGVTFSYNGAPVLRSVTFEVAQGGFAGIVGPNGCGKSTLMRLLLGMLEPAAGRIAVLGRSPLVAVREGDVGYVPQRETFARAFPLTVYDVVLMGRSPRVGLGKRPGREDRRRALAALERFGLADFARRPFGDLSGGQQRLVLLCRAMAQEPRLLLMDEADTGLDEERRAQVYHEIDHWRLDHGVTVAAISHQLDLLASFVDHAITLRNGEAVAWCSTCMHHAVGERQPVHMGPLP